MQGGAIALVVAMAALAGCQATHQPQNVPMTVGFNEANFRWSKENGASSISGQAFLKTIGGDVKTCAGNEVVLVPDNEYTMDIARIAVDGNVAIKDQRYGDYQRIKRCDASGSFVFYSLPAGRWRVTTDVHWSAPSQYGLLPQGGVLLSIVDTDGKSKKEIIMSTQEVLCSVQNCR